MHSIAKKLPLKAPMRPCERTAAGVDWFSNVDAQHMLHELFEYIPEVAFFAKDCQGCFTLVNSRFVAMLRCQHEGQVIGRNDYDFFPHHIADKYTEDDRRVIATGDPLLQVVELVPQDDLTLAWHEANKFPVLNKKGRVVGIAGITVKLSPTHMPFKYPSNLGHVLVYIGQNYSCKITIRELAEIAHMSERSLERHFSRTFNSTPLRYLKKVRINAACHALAHTSKSIAEITLECGFCDQSHMTSDFRKILGTTPREYRLKNSVIR